ncbi:MAG: aminotransferase class III-fold pyridoxal phosphate-dependent enzyme [Trichodesmium sp. MAG_R02]|jgi:malonyl CoA-acyl carrier protein transacylase|nr:aminotransferase class III-fold pyridoxal phosphate-dependent enzyme [Trichodesmium sp. MAG_R02]
MTQKLLRESIAIIGMGCRFPKSPDPKAFEQLLVNGVDAISEVPTERWSAAQFYHQDPQTPGKMNTRWGGFLDQVAEFDPAFFNISPKEAPRIDPQQRLVMEVSWESLENAGLSPHSLKGSQTGLFVGIGNFDYGRLLCRDWDQINAYNGTGLTLSLAANRVSYFLGLHGPSLVVETACSSSLVAVHLACQSLQQRECHLALAGGVSLIILPDMTITFSQSRMMSGEGRCKTFDEKADGYVRGEGCGMIVLKRLSEAVESGDRILAVIKGSAVNHDGFSNGLTAPNGFAQQAVIREALKGTGISPQTVSYLEAHGTATPLGDPVEMRAIQAVLREGRTPDNKCAVGSVKTNIGHLENAAGIAGIIKVILSLQKQQIFPHLHLNKLNPYIEIADTPFFIPTKNLPWNPVLGKRVAGVSSFSFGGTNCHIILEEAPAKETLSSYPDRNQHLLSLSAKSESALQALAQRYHSFLQEKPHLSLGDVCFTANTGRSHFPHRLALWGENSSQIQELLQKFSHKQESPGFIPGKFSGRKPPKIVFLFTGQSSQYRGMGKQLYETQPRFRHLLEQCDEILSPYLSKSLIKILYSADSEANLIHQTVYTQPALFALEYALAQLWISWGIKPDAVIGHSLGEYVAACVAGVFSLEDGLKLIATRAKLMDNLPENGKMVAIFAKEDQVKAILAQVASPIVAIATLNSEENTVISGEKQAVEKVVEILEQKGFRNRPLNVSHAFHSPLIEPMLEQWQESMEGISFNKPQISLISNLTGEFFPDDKIPEANYWRQQTRNPVRFKEGIDTLFQQKYRLFVEIGPKPILSKLAQRRGEGTWLPSLVEGLEDWQILASSLANLYIEGAAVNWKGWDSDYSRYRLSLPTYPFQRKPYWLEDSENVMLENHSSNPPIGQTALNNVHQQQIIKELSTLVGDLLKIPVAEVDCSAPLLEMGADSLVLLDLIQTIENKYGLKIQVNQLFEVWPTIEGLGNHIAQQLPTSPPTDTPTPEISQKKPLIPDTTPSPVNHKTSPETALERIISQQLQVMSEQLALLQGKSLTASQPSPIPLTREMNGFSDGKTEETEKKTSPRKLTQAQNFTPQQQQHLDDLISRYSAKTPKSKARAASSRPILADSRAVAGFRPSIKEMLYPIVGERAQGSHFWDIDGHKYLDITMGFGVLLFGHNAPVITQAVTAQLEKGLQIGPQSNLAAEVAHLIQDLTGVQRVTFCNSGTEAVMTALRLARTVTGRSKIALFTGAYHGHFDGVLALAVSGTTEAVPMAAGIAENAVKDLLVLDYNNPDSLEILSRQTDELAAVLVEPVPSRNPNVQPKAFLQKLRALTQTAQIPLIFDEVLLGFRIHPGGAQKWLEIEADIVTYGKIVGGGLPIGVVAGKGRYLDALDGGEWNYGDNSYPSAEKTFFAGTFNKNHLGMAAARGVLQYLKQQGKTLQQQLNESTARLADTLNHYFEIEQIPLEIVYFGSLFRFASNGNIDLLYYHLLEKGVYIWEGRNCFLSTAHSDEDIDFLIGAIKESVMELRQGGFFPFLKPSQPVISQSSLQLLNPKVINARLLPEMETLTQQSKLENYSLGFAELEKLSFAYIICAFAELGAKFSPGEQFTHEVIAKNLEIIPQHYSLLKRLLEVMAEEDILSLTRDHWEVINSPEPMNPQRLAETILAQYPFLKAELTLLNRCASALAEVLQGKINPLQLIFPQGDFTLATQLYQTSTVARFLNTLVQKTVSLALELVGEDEIVQILEIGAGTGGTTAYILPELPPELVKYYFTDLSALFLNRAKQKFQDYPFVEYDSLDIEQAPAAHKPGKAQYHIIIAANVLHSTANLYQTLQNIQQLLIPGGMVILMEGISPQRWLDLIFGLTEGWWKFSDLELRPAYPLVSVEKWQNILQETGFTDIIALPGQNNPIISQQAVIIARYPHKIPLTQAQKQLWTLAQLEDEGSIAYNESLRLEFKGKLDIYALNQAIQTVINRHEALRILIDDQGEMQEILPRWEIDIPYLDFTDTEQEEIKAWLDKTVRKPFQISNSPLLRVKIVKIAPEVHWLVLTIHHIISDGWSVDLIVNELARFYNAQTQGIELKLGKPRQFSHYVQMMGEINPNIKQDQVYWLKQFSDTIPQLDLPTDFPRPKIQTYRGKKQDCLIEAKIKGKLEQLSNHQGCTLFMTLLAIFTLLLRYLSQENDLVIGISAAGQLACGWKNLVGYCVNVLPVRFRSQKETFSEYLKAVKQELLNSYQHQSYPYSQLLQKLNLKRDPSRPPLIHVQFNLDKFGEELNFANLEVNPVLNFSGATRRDLTWNLAETKGDLRLNATYNADLFKPETIDNWIAKFTTILPIVVQQPDISLDDISQHFRELEQQKQHKKAEKFQAIAQQKLKRVQRKTLKQDEVN